MNQPNWQQNDEWAVVVAQFVKRSPKSNASQGMQAFDLVKVTEP